MITGMYEYFVYLILLCAKSLPGVLRGRSDKIYWDLPHLHGPLPAPAEHSCLRTLICPPGLSILAISLLLRAPVHQVWVRHYRQVSHQRNRKPCKHPSFSGSIQGHTSNGSSQKGSDQTGAAWMAGEISLLIRARNPLVIPAKLAPQRSAFIGSISTADGSALVRLGNTTVVCGVKAEIAEPELDAGNRGFLGAFLGSSSESEAYSHPDQSPTSTSRQCALQSSSQVHPQTKHKFCQTASMMSLSRWSHPIMLTPAEPRLTAAYTQLWYSSPRIPLYSTQQGRLGPLCRRNMYKLRRQRV